MITTIALFLILLTGYRGGDLTYTLYRLHCYGRTAPGVVTERKVCSGRSTRYLVRYTFLQLQGQCPVSADVFRCCPIGTEVTVLHDPEDSGRSWLAAGRSTLFWGALFFDGSFSLLVSSVIWLALCDPGRR